MTDPPSSHTDIEDLVFACLEAEDPGHAVEELCRARPEIAADLQRVFAVLETSGLFGAGQIDRAAAAEPEIPEQLGGFKLLRRLGAGGMGVVYLAEEQSLGRKVAIKLVRPEQLYFPDARERFRREVEAIARLQHPGIVTILSVGEENGIPYYSMDYVRGITLAQVIAHLRGRDPARLQGHDLLALLADGAGADDDSSTSSGGLPANRSWSALVIQLVHQVAAALAHAHALGVLHRDVKPSNVILNRGGHARLLDFGLARTDDTGQELTRSTAHLGSLPYMTPEQLAQRIEQPTPRIDVYGLGVTLYELLTLRSPFLARDPEETRQNILQGRCAPLRQLNPSVSWEVETVCKTAMEQSPSRRYQSMLDLQRDLENLLERRPIQARPTGFWLRALRFTQRNPTAAVAAAMGSVLLALSLAFAVQQHDANVRASKASYHLGVTAASAQLDQRQVRAAKESLAMCPPELRRFEWYHLAARTDASAQVYRGHTDGVRALAVHPDGEQFACGAEDGRVLLFRLDDREPPRELLPAVAGATASISAMAFAPGGAHLFVGGFDQRIRRVAVPAGGASELAAMADVITALALDGPGHRVYAGAADGEIAAFDPHSGERVAVLRPGTKRDRFTALQPVRHLVFSADRRRLIASHLAEVLVFDLGTQQLVRSFSAGNRNWIHFLGLDAEGHIATGGLDGVLAVWHAETGEPIQSATSHLSGISCGCFDARHENVLVSGPDGTIGVLDAASLQVRKMLLGHDGRILDFAAAGAAGVLTASQDRTVRLWRHDAHAGVRILGRHGDAVRALAVTPDGRFAVTGGSDGVVREWDLATGAVRDLHVGGKVLGLCLDPRGRRVLFLAAGLHHLDRTANGAAVPIAAPFAPSAIALLASGERFAAASQDGELWLAGFAAQDEGQRAALPGKDERERFVTALAACPWNDTVYAGTVEGAIYGWDGTGPPQWFGELPRGVCVLAFDAPRKLLWAGGLNGRIRRFDVAARRAVEPDLSWDDQLLSDITFTNDGSRMVTASMGETMQVWDLREDSRVLALRGHTRGVFAVRFTPDGKRLVSVSWDKTVRVWETRD